MGYENIGKGAELAFYLFLGVVCFIGCCIGCCCKIAYDRLFIAHQHQEVNQGTLIDLLSGTTDNNNSSFLREIELSPNQSYIEESISLLGTSHED